VPFRSTVSGLGGSRMLENFQFSAPTSLVSELERLDRASLG
tara:strand:- start:286 stop:408 length:123 start_codon:yes stop_codon:yes gene_type:complete